MTSILETIKMARELNKRAFAPPQGGPQGAAPMPPPPPEPPQGTPMPLPPQGDPNAMPPPPDAPTQEPPQDDNKDLITLVEKMGDDLDKKSTKIDALEAKLNAQDSKVNELYGNLSMLLNIIEKGSASSALKAPKL